MAFVQWVGWSFSISDKFQRLVELKMLLRAVAMLPWLFSLSSLMLLWLMTSYCTSLETLSTLSKLSLKRILLEGRQSEREESLSFENVCRCQCRDDLEVFDTRFNSFKGNCRTKENGFYWCYIPDDAIPYCRHAVKGRYADSYYSLDACYTPAPDEGPCSVEWRRKYVELDTVLLDMCAIRKGAFDSNTPDTENIIEPCYQPNGGGQPHMGCRHRVETLWGPALPCDCINVTFTETPVNLSNGRHLYCQDGAGEAFGGRLVDTTATGALGHVRVRQAWKARRRCSWKIVPKTGGIWRCVRN